KGADSCRIQGRTTPSRERAPSHRGPRSCTTLRPDREYGGRAPAAILSGATRRTTVAMSVPVFDPIKVAYEVQWLKDNPHFSERPANIIEFLGPGYLDIYEMIRPGVLDT